MPRIGVLPSLSGVSWFAVEVTASVLPSTTSQVQPLPKRLTPASLTCSISESRPPKVELIASASSPWGSPRPVGPLGSFQRLVGVVNVGLVVLVVVEAHCLLVDVRLEGRVVIRKRWNFE